MEKSTACLISDHSEFREKVSNSLKPQSLIELLKFSSVAEFIKWSKGQKINGVILDFKSLIKTNIAEKEFLNFLEKKIILARSNFNPTTKEIASQVNGEFYQGSVFFDYFISQVLDPKVSKYIRKTERTETVWSVEVYSESSTLIEKAVTKNVSSGGLFILTCKEYNSDANYKVKIIDIDKTELFDFQVKWSIPWGNASREFPGIGIEFKNLSPEKQNQIAERLDGHARA